MSLRFHYSCWAPSILLSSTGSDVKNVSENDNFSTVIGQNLVKAQLCVVSNGHELQPEEAKRLLHVDLVKTMARKKTYHQTYKNLIFGYKNCNSFYYIAISIIEEN